MKRDVDALVAEINPHPGPGERTPGARELMDEITSAPGTACARTPRRRRRLITIPLAAGLAAAALVATWALPITRPANAAPLDIEQQGGYYVISVKDLFAAPERYQAQLKSAGIDITLRVIPVSPNLEGTVTGPVHPPYDRLTPEQIARRKDLISAIEAPGACATRPGACTIGFRIPVNYPGQDKILLGRKTRPGEGYMAFSPIQSIGEPLHCVPFMGKTVDRVRGLLRQHGVNGAIFFDGSDARSSVPGSWIVHEGFMSRPGTATLLVSPTHKRPNVPGPSMSGDDCAN